MEQLLPIVLFLAGLALMTTILMRRFYRQVGRRRKTYDSRPIDTQPRPQSKWSGIQADFGASIARQEVELAELSRDVNAQIDTKVMVLRELVSQSQAQIARMEELLAELKTADPHVATTGVNRNR